MDFNVIGPLQIIRLLVKTSLTMNTEGILLGEADCKNSNGGEDNCHDPTLLHNVTKLLY